MFGFLTSGLMVISIFFENVVFPSEIFTGKTLVVLKLSGNVGLKGPKLFCLPNLNLEHLTVLGDNTDWAFASILPLLDELQIYGVEFCDVGSININSPCLKMLVWTSNLVLDRLFLIPPS